MYILSIYQLITCTYLVESTFEFIYVAMSASSDSAYKPRDPPRTLVCFKTTYDQTMDTRVNRLLSSSGLFDLTSPSHC